MKTTSFIAILSFAFLFNSCSKEDPQDNTPEEQTELKLSSYKYTYDRQSPDGGTYQRIRTVNLIDEKFTDFTEERYLNGELVYTESLSQFIYENNFPKKVLNGTQIDDPEAPAYLNFFYNDVQQLIGFHWESNNRYYRISYPQENIVFFDALDGTLDDPDAQIIRRSISEFDQHDNIIRAGRDNDLDGVIDANRENHFTYDQNHNLTSIVLYNGETHNATYSDKKNTYNVILDNSYSKKIRRIVMSEAFSFMSSIESSIFERYSHYLSNQQLSENTYEFVEDFYTKQTHVFYDSDSEFTITNEFFIEE